MRAGTGSAHWCRCCPYVGAARATRSWSHPPRGAGKVTQRPVTVNNTGRECQSAPAVSLPSLFAYRGETSTTRRTRRPSRPPSRRCAASRARWCCAAAAVRWRSVGTTPWPAAVRPPTAAEIYPLIPANDPTVYSAGAFTPLRRPNDPWTLKTFTAADIRNDARYKGGEIGFVMMGGGALQPEQVLAARAEPAVHRVHADASRGSPRWCTPAPRSPTPITWRSRTCRSAPTSFTENNDGDFNDFVFYITGSGVRGRRRAVRHRQAGRLRGRQDRLQRRRQAGSVP